MKAGSITSISVVNCCKEFFLNEICADVRKGLTAMQKYLPCKYFYDDRGSYLFEQICRLPEYYQTRTELSILQEAAPAIMERFSGGYLVELGSGANWKVRTLLDAAYRKKPADICYLPVDVNESTLRAAAMELVEIYPWLSVQGIVADFTQLAGKVPADGDKLFLFFGSTIGNFTEAERTAMLRSIADIMGYNDRLLLGIDMIKDIDVMERAYDDSRGVTCEFNKNILRVVNRETEANFQADHFDHLAFYNGDKEQIEMHLKANRDVVANVKGLDLNVTLAKGETIHTEICAKFSHASAQRMAVESGLQIDRWYADPKGWFSLVALTRSRDWDQKHSK
jgi:L-histidine Nalpha-methyltransferase